MTDSAAVAIISQDYVVDTLTHWLAKQGYQCTGKRLGTRFEIDIEAVQPFDQERLIVDCRGEAGSQGRQESWPDIAQAFFFLIRDSETADDQTQVSMALPDTSEFRQRMAGMKEFCLRQRIGIFWVGLNGHVRRWDEPCHGEEF